MNDIDANKFYNDLKSVYGFRDEKGTILPWIICDLVRLWNLRVPKGLKLSKNSRDMLNKLGLSPPMTLMLKIIHMSTQPCSPSLRIAKKIKIKIFVIVALYTKTINHC